MQAMKKQKAIEMLGGTITIAAKKIGISYQAVNKWPDPLPARIADRVHAAAAREQGCGKIEPITHGIAKLNAHQPPGDIIALERDGGFGVKFGAV